MNDADTSSHQGKIAVWWNMDQTRALEPVVSGMSGALTEQLALIPSSLAPDDMMAQDVQVRLGLRDVRSRIVVPRAPQDAMLQALPGRAGGWARIKMGSRSARIDRGILEPHVVGIIPITARQRSGPYALDLASHFLHPLDRARLLLSRDRPLGVAEVAAAVPLDYWLVGTLVGTEQLWLTTGDIIAAELWSLVLAERFHDHDVEMLGPWEDPTIQRATELDLGARIPSELRITFHTNGQLPPAVRDVIVVGCQRLGMSIPPVLL